MDQERVVYFANLDAAEKFKRTLEADLDIRNVQLVKIIGDFDSAQEKVWMEFLGHSLLFGTKDNPVMIDEDDE